MIRLIGRDLMLETVIPTLEDMWFRESLLADEETMSYNHAWGGTISWPKENGGNGMNTGSSIMRTRDTTDI